VRSEPQASEVNLGNACPPFARQIWPVQKREASDARYSTSQAWSSGSPTRPSGDRARIAPRKASRRAGSTAPSGPRRWRLVKFVSVAPGAITFTRMPWAPTSVASVCDSIVIAALVSA
jgi:hypothetical protein